MDPGSPPRLPRDHPLAGCEQKLRRAQVHAQELHDELRGLGSGEFRAATFRTEKKPGAKNVFCTVVETVEEPSLHIATIIGDVVHNLRSPLDHLVFELAFLGLRGRRIPEKTAFPGSRDRANWNSRYVQETMLDGVLKQHRAMLYQLQPCYRRKDRPTEARLRRRGRRAASDLQYLWNEDKHRLLQAVSVTPVEVIPKLAFRSCAPRGALIIHPGFLGRPLKEGTEVVTVPFRPTGPNPKVDVHIEISCEVSLRSGLPVRYALGHIGDWVEHVIQRFEPIFETPHARRLWGLPRGSWVETEPLRRPRVSIGRWRLEGPHPATTPTG